MSMSELHKPEWYGECAIIYDKLVDCLEKCLICRHIRRFAD